LQKSRSDRARCYRIDNSTYPRQFQQIGEQVTHGIGCVLQERDILFDGFAIEENNRLRSEVSFLEQTGSLLIDDLARLGERLMKPAVRYLPSSFIGAASMPKPL
jgi:hypothetical protein